MLQKFLFDVITYSGILWQHDTQHNSIQHNAIQLFATLSIINETQLSSVILLSVAFFIVKLNVIMLSVIMLNVIMLNVVAPFSSQSQPKKLFFGLHDNRLASFVRHMMVPG
jgi:hypothetical protein